MTPHGLSRQTFRSPSANDLSHWGQCGLSVRGGSLHTWCEEAGPFSFTHMEAFVYATGGGGGAEESRKSWISRRLNSVVSSLHHIKPYTFRLSRVYEMSSSDGVL